MMRSRSIGPYRVVKYVALFAISVVGCERADVPGQGSELPTAYTETVTSKSGETISFKMVPVPGGTFVMGSPEDEPGGKDDERPQHKVRVAPFYLCTTETTLELFLAYYQETVSPKEDFVGVQQEKKNAEQASRDDVDAITGPTLV